MSFGFVFVSISITTCLSSSTSSSIQNRYAANVRIHSWSQLPDGIRLVGTHDFVHNVCALKLAERVIYFRLLSRGVDADLSLVEERG